MGLHLRGNTEGFMRAARSTSGCASTPGRITTRFYSEEGRREQLRLFDYWLKGVDNGIMRRAAGQAADPQGRTWQLRMAAENEWPLERTRWTKSFLQPRRAVATRIDREALGEAPRKGVRCPIPPAA